MSDPAEEKRRLAGYYFSLTDGEIENLAENKAELTGYAIEALDVELARRRLGEVLPDHLRTVDEFEFQRLVTIRQFRDLPEALLAKVPSNPRQLNAIWPMTTWYVWTGLFLT